VMSLDCIVWAPSKGVVFVSRFCYNWVTMSTCDKCGARFPSQQLMCEHFIFVHHPNYVLESSAQGQPSEALRRPTNNQTQLQNLQYQYPNAQHQQSNYHNWQRNAQQQPPNVAPPQVRRQSPNSQYQDPNASPPREGQFDLNQPPNVSTFDLNKPATSK
jgi:hypothetical protein